MRHGDDRAVGAVVVSEKTMAAIKNYGSAAYYLGESSAEDTKFSVDEQCRNARHETAMCAALIAAIDAEVEAAVARLAALTEKYGELWDRYCAERDDWERKAKEFTPDDHVRLKLNDNALTIQRLAERCVAAEAALAQAEAALVQVLWHWGTDADRKIVFDHGGGWRTSTDECLAEVRALVLAAPASPERAK